ncbi:MAG: discoidin domain-containing protein [Verrucomicrobia bacterium]|nr:discoidin domain-containing protein [Verrucomicrobiota bacterium]
MTTRLLSLLVVAGATITGACAQDKVPLKVDFPRPLFAGTPRPIQLPNLEPALVGKRPDFMVPAGTALLSKGKPVTSSDTLPVIGELSFITDGDKTGIDGAYVELGPNPQWVQIDLGAPAKIAAIVVWHFHSQARVYHDVIVQVSDRADFKQNVRTLYNNDDNNSAGLGKGADLAYVETNHGRIIDGKGATARYVRLYSNGSTSDELNHYCEVEVFGQPAK